MLRQIQQSEWGLTLGSEYLHCGDELQVLMPTEDGGAKLVRTRLEMADDYWYFIGLPGVDVCGCFARPE